MFNNSLKFILRCQKRSKFKIEAFEFALDSQSPRKKRSIDNLMEVDISDIQSVRLKCSLNPDGLYRPDLEGGQDCVRV